MTKSRFWLLLINAVIALQLGPSLSFADSGPAFISIIIDDMGNNRRLGERAIELPAALTYAVIPDAHYAARLAGLAHAAGKEVMIHMPMENKHQLPLGTLALTRDLSREEFLQTFNQALSLVPHARGINNHMGSVLTREARAMGWLMESIAEHRLFFVDSRTTPETVASAVARQRNILSASRDVFLDNERTLYEIDVQFRRLLTLARRRGTAIAIGHPHNATIEYLSRAIPQLAAEGITVIPVSRMILLRRARQQLASLTQPGGGD